MPLCRVGIQSFESVHIHLSAYTKIAANSECFRVWNKQSGSHVLSIDCLDALVCNSGQLKIALLI